MSRYVPIDPERFHRKQALREMQEIIERGEGYERWYAAQTRCYRRWYLATQFFTWSWPVVGIGSIWLDWPWWIWLTLVPPMWVCRRAWKASYQRLQDGMDHHLDWLKSLNR
jgi:uncharacterized membrane protein YdbT with pleckstrin-like domain